MHSMLHNVGKYINPWTYKLTHTPTVAQGGGGGVDGPHLLVFVLLRQREINLH